MSNDSFKPQKPIAGQNKAVLSIVFDPDAPPDKHFMVNGPFENGILFLGMLEMAKATFYEWRQRQTKEAEPGGHILIPRFVPPSS